MDTCACFFGRRESLHFPLLCRRVPWKGKHTSHHFGSLQPLEFSCCLTLFSFLFESHEISQRAALSPCGTSEIRSPFCLSCSRYLHSPGDGHVWELPLLSFLQTSEKSSVRVLVCFWDDCNCQGLASLVTQLNSFFFNHFRQQNSCNVLLSWDEKLTWTLFWLRFSDLWRSGPLWSAVELRASFVFTGMGLYVHVEEQPAYVAVWEHRPGRKVLVICRSLSKTSSWRLVFSLLLAEKKWKCQWMWPLLHSLSKRNGEKRILDVCKTLKTHILENEYT